LSLQLGVHVPCCTMAFIVLNRNLFSKDELQIEPVKKMTPRKKKLTKKVRKN